MGFKFSKVELDINSKITNLQYNLEVYSINTKIQNDKTELQIKNNNSIIDQIDLKFEGELFCPTNWTSKTIVISGSKTNKQFHIEYKNGLPYLIKSNGLISSDFSGDACITGLNMPFLFNLSKNYTIGFTENYAAASFSKNSRKLLSTTKSKSMCVRFLTRKLIAIGENECKVLNISGKCVGSLNLGKYYSPYIYHFGDDIFCICHFKKHKGYHLRFFDIYSLIENEIKFVESVNVHTIINSIYYYNTSTFDQCCDNILVTCTDASDYSKTRYSIIKFSNGLICEVVLSENEAEFLQLKSNLVLHRPSDATFTKVFEIKQDRYFLVPSKEQFDVFKFHFYGILQKINLLSCITGIIFSYLTCTYILY